MRVHRACVSVPVGQFSERRLPVRESWRQTVGSNTYAALCVMRQSTALGLWILARCYEFGKGVGKDHSEAVRCVIALLGRCAVFDVLLPASVRGVRRSLEY